MKRILQTTFILLMAVAAFAQPSYVTTTNSVPGACTGTAIFNDSLSQYNVISWDRDTLQIQVGGNSVTDLCPGTYTVSFFDSNGTYTENFTIGIDTGGSSPCANFYADVNVTNVSGSNLCDGSVDVVVTGGTPPYSYMWSDNSTGASNSGLCTGAYTVYVTDSNGCNTNATAYIGDDSIPNGPCDNFYVNAISTNTSGPSSCDGVADVNVYGGSGSYTFSWDNGITTSSSSIGNLCPGTYNVMVMDNDSNACTGSASVVISGGGTSLPGLVIDVYSFDSDSCAGEAYFFLYNNSGSYGIYVTDADGASYPVDTLSWGVTNLCAGVYSVYAYDFGTNDTVFTTFIIGDSSTTFYNTPYPDSSSYGNISSGGQLVCDITYNAIDSVLISYYTYTSLDSIMVVWDVYSNEGTTTIYEYYAVYGGGLYTLILQIFCDELRASQFIKAYDQVYINPLTVGINEKPISKTTIYPVPAGSILNISLASETSTVSILNAIGQEVLKSVKFSGKEIHSLNIEGLNSGYYIVKVESGNTTEFIKFTKE